VHLHARWRIHPRGSARGSGAFGTHSGAPHGGADWRFAGHGFHDRRFHDGVVIVPFGYYAWYAGYPYSPTVFDTYCSQLSPSYDAHVCWDYYDD
jgi:hypothetical protein